MAEREDPDYVRFVTYSEQLQRETMERVRQKTADDIASSNANYDWWVNRLLWVWVMYLLLLVLMGPGMGWVLSRPWTTGLESYPFIVFLWCCLTFILVVDFAARVGIQF